MEPPHRESVSTSIAAARSTTGLLAVQLFRVVRGVFALEASWVKNFNGVLFSTPRFFDHKCQRKCFFAYAKDKERVAVVGLVFFLDE
jgi:hypothetical protein